MSESFLVKQFSRWVNELNDMDGKFNGHLKLHWRAKQTPECHAIAEAVETILNDKPELREFVTVENNCSGFPYFPSAAFTVHVNKSDE